MPFKHTFNITILISNNTFNIFIVIYCIEHETKKQKTNTLRKYQIAFEWGQWGNCDAFRFLFEKKSTVSVYVCGFFLPWFCPTGNMSDLPQRGYNKHDVGMWTN